MSRGFALCLLVVAALLAASRVACASTAFTYQGLLTQGGTPVSGAWHLRFRLWDAADAGAPVGPTIDLPAVTVVNGVFTVELDFGANAFNGEARWLDVQVLTGGGATITTLEPRQPMLPAPYAMRALNVVLPSTYPDAVSLTNAANQFIGSGAGLSDLNGSSITTGTVSDARISGNIPRLDAANQAFTGFANFTGTCAAANLRLYTNPSPGRVMVCADFLGNGAWQNAALWSNNGASAYYNAGNVGIGTSSPGKRLTVAGDMEIGTSAGDYRHLRIGGGNSSGFLYGSFPHFADGIHIGYNYYADSAGNNVIANGGGGTSRITMGYGFIALATNPAFAGEPATRMTIAENGKVGIGTTAPVGALHVEINGAATSTGSAVYSRNMAPSGTYFGVYGYAQSSSGYDFMAGGPGINYGSPSSIRWKRNIEPLRDPLAMLAAMRGIYFDWDDEHGGQRDLGMVAEEVGAVLPEIVNFEDNGIDATGMDYSRLTPLLVEAVKALRAEKDDQVAALRDENVRLHQQMAELVRRIEALEGRRQ